MPNQSITVEKRFIWDVEKGNTRGVESALAAGVSVDASGELVGMPLVVAVMHDRFGIAKLLIEKGANLEICIQPNAHPVFTHTSGLRVLHFAAGDGKLRMLRVLLQAGANPNSTDEFGCTPLMEASRNNSASQALIVQELVKGGADPAQPDDVGRVAMHYAAGRDLVDVMDMLLSLAPTTLNRTTLDGSTPLHNAAISGKDRAVAYLLSMGARNGASFATAGERGAAAFRCPLASAVLRGHRKVVRILLDDGLEAIGGSSVIPVAVVVALQNRRPRILQRLLNVEGEGRRGYWAARCYKKNPMIYFAAAYADPTGMSILLAAGADETTLDSGGQRAREVVGLSMRDEKKDAVRVAAVLRTLKRGPAFRAQSWRWPSRMETGTTTTAAASAAVTADDDAPLSSRASRAPLDVRVFKPRDRTSLVKIVSRYAEKR